ncbi:hypothetical protein ARMA_2831 [Ardenticatena maritima]|uniref:Short-chain dehydrogenase n=1 Tax=Ardenticatena maritima TaxID=872965 RepID=A0A0N0RFV2_9CHLR|nr:SDR family oxidoreductase [Ardenticatena maritima]KPL89489.1 short-chain dehydrogenase [Ardenticatena maritima]GAP64408.1 hypothetical protein ARMA_2831 [Ardenticatena maritima]
MANVCIVGATSAIAEATTRHFAARGDRLFLVGRSPDKLAMIADDMRVRGAAQVETFLLDVNEIERHTEMLDAAEAALGPLDVVLIAHGTLPDQRECERSVAKTLEAFQTNAVSTIALLTEIANRFEARGRGVIAVISSVAGDRGRQSNYVYGAAKGAVNIFTQGLRNRLAKKGVAVVTIKPGFVDTPMTAHLPKNALFASPEQVGARIFKAIERREDVVYVPWFWFVIMTIIRHIPERLFKRLNL